MSIYREIDFRGLAELLGSVGPYTVMNFRGNLGDALIRSGQRALEAEFGLARLEPLPNRKFEAAMVIPGGGNLVEGYYSTARRRLSTMRRGCRGVVLPHTVRGCYFELRRHPDLIVVCREPVTYEHLVRAGFEPRRLRLCHDLAFALQGRRTTSIPPSVVSAGPGTLVALRRDAEAAGHEEHLSAASFDVTGQASGFWSSAQETDDAAAKLLDFVGHFETVVTDRLHVAIAGHLVGRRTWLLPNSYGKNASVCSYSMADSPYVTYVEHPREIPPSTLANADRARAARLWGTGTVSGDPLMGGERARLRIGLARRQLTGTRRAT